MCDGDAMIQVIVLVNRFTVFSLKIFEKGCHFERRVMCSSMIFKSNALQEFLQKNKKYFP